MWDLENLNEQRTFYFEEDQKEYVILQIASSAETNNMRKQAGIKQKVEYLKDSDGKQVRSEFLDTNEDNMEKLSDLVNDFCIVDWCLFDKNGEKIPCTKENKILMMGKSIKFSKFVAKNLEILRKDIEGEDGEELKN